MYSNNGVKLVYKVSAEMHLKGVIKPSHHTLKMMNIKLKLDLRFFLLII